MDAHASRPPPPGRRRSHASRRAAAPATAPSTLVAAPAGRRGRGRRQPRRRAPARSPAPAASRRPARWPPGASRRGRAAANDPLRRGPVDPARRAAHAEAQQPQVGRQREEPGEDQHRVPRRPRRRSRRAAPRASKATQPGRPNVARAARTSAIASSGERRIQPRRSGTLRVSKRSSATAAQAPSAVLRGGEDHHPRPPRTPGGGIEGGDREHQEAGIGDDEVADGVPQVVVEERGQRCADEGQEGEAQEDRPLAVERQRQRGDHAGRPRRTPRR